MNGSARMAVEEPTVSTAVEVVDPEDVD